MILHFRNAAPPQAACPLDGLIENARRPAQEELPLADADRDFDFLLKHALSGAQVQPDGGRVWQQIARKMRGPFGSPALEGPGCTTFEQVLMSSGGRVQLAPFVL